MSFAGRATSCFAALGLLLSGCSADGAEDGRGGSGGGSQGVACADAQDGDPCSVAGDSCGALECYGCYSQCDGETWTVSCSEQPACTEEAPRWASPCDDYCGPFECGPYAVETPCGTESITATCSIFGWAYPTECAPDCRVATDAQSCKAILDCFWVQPCEGSDDLEPRCLSLVSPFADGGIGFGFCDGTCPETTTCVGYSVNRSDIESGDCSGEGAAAFACIPIE